MFNPNGNPDKKYPGVNQDDGTITDPQALEQHILEERSAKLADAAYTAAAAEEYPRKPFREDYTADGNEPGEGVEAGVNKDLERQANEFLAQHDTGNTEESASNAGSAVDLRGTKPYAEPYQPDNETTGENIA